MVQVNISDLIATTKKAVLLNVNGAEEWFPISQLEFDGLTFTIPAWLVQAKNF